MTDTSTPNSSYGRAPDDMSGAKYINRIDLPDGTILWCRAELLGHLKTRVQNAIDSPLYPGEDAYAICAYLQMYRYRCRWLPQSAYEPQQYVVTRD